MKRITTIIAIAFTLNAYSQASGLKINTTVQTDKGASSNVNLKINNVYLSKPSTVQLQVYTFLHVVDNDTLGVPCKVFYPVELKAMYQYKVDSLVYNFLEKGTTATSNDLYKLIEHDSTLTGLNFTKIP